MTKEGNEIKSYIVIDTADSSSVCIWIFIYTFFAAWVKKIVISVKIVVYVYGREEPYSVEEVRKV